MIYTKECAVCGSTFESSRENTRYCSDKCRNRRDANGRKRDRKSEKAKKANVESEKSKKPKNSIDDVIRFCIEYEKRTGRYLSLGKAVVMMER